MCAANFGINQTCGARSSFFELSLVISFPEDDDVPPSLVGLLKVLGLKLKIPPTGSDCVEAVGCTVGAGSDGGASSSISPSSLSSTRAVLRFTSTSGIRDSAVSNFFFSIDSIARLRRRASAESDIFHLPGKLPGPG